MECNVCKLCVRLIVCLFVCLSVHPSVRLSVRVLSVCVFVTGRLPACANVVCMLVCCMYNLYQKSSMNVSNMCLDNPQKTSACHVSNSGQTSPVTSWYVFSLLNQFCSDLLVQDPFVRRGDGKIWGSTGDKLTDT